MASQTTAAELPQIFLFLKRYIIDMYLYLFHHCHVCCSSPSSSFLR